MEEAGIPQSLSSQCRGVGAISYFMELSRGLYPEIQFVYDLQIPNDFKPQNTDGEVGAFYHLTLNEVLEKIRNNEFKPNCALITIDFLIRHGHISPENELDYVEIVAGCHKNLFDLEQFLK